MSLLDRQDLFPAPDPALEASAAMAAAIIDLRKRVIILSEKIDLILAALIVEVECETV